MRNTFARQRGFASEMRGDAKAWGVEARREINFSVILTARGSLRATCATATADAWTETITRTTTRTSTDATTPARSPSANASRKMALVVRSLALEWPSLALDVWRLGAPLIRSVCGSHDTHMVVTGTQRR